MISLVKRNLIYNVRDRVAFILSFLAVIILLIIYKAFLSNFQIDELKKAAHSSNISQAGMDMINLWLVAGLIIVISVTTTLSGFGVMVEDKENKKINDFRLSSISSFKLMISYYLSSFILGIFILLIAFILGVAIFVGIDEIIHIDFIKWLKIISILILSNLFGVSFGLLLANVLSTRSSFATASTIVGTLIGFLAGVYITIGNLGDIISKVILILPMIHIAALLKQILMKDSINDFFVNVPDHYQENYEKTYGIYLYWDNIEISNFTSISIVIGWILLMLIINVLIITVQRRK
ncbi:ABC transporter permease [Staphylococcus felis]|uniref:ABC transporter permease n=2 Tax=Staphylococcus felis TaxID=46127 RepID=UPI000D0BA251|nr:ABC transporter permease [Staphylococcus felis]AVP36020.1 ABC transporter permease [Staphylococcus felis]QQB04009.1 ABC transporter permease [Staphylococcus felis]